MKAIEIRSQIGRSTVLTGRHLLPKIGFLMRRAGQSGCVMVVTQKKIASLYLDVVRQALEKQGFHVFVHYVPQGEAAKSQRELFRIYSTLLRRGFERRDAVLALGGGVVGDLAGFAAATYLRGIPFFNVATTLLAQVDSAIGGKTGINLKEGKNLVGAFCPARLVFSDTSVLGSLSARQLRAAYAEVIKYGVIRDAVLFELLESFFSGNQKLSQNFLNEIIRRSAMIKASVVSRDERETGRERMILNYGHTFGHGFEQATAYKSFLHGEAVALGMVCAAKLATALKWAPLQVEERIVRLIRSAGLPVTLKGKKISQGKVISAMRRDKKVRGGKPMFILARTIGRVEICDEVPMPVLRQILNKVGVEQ